MSNWDEFTRRLTSAAPDLSTGDAPSDYYTRKADQGKLDWTLLPTDSLIKVMGWVEETVRVLEFGAKKYERESWREVEHSTRRYTAALIRHVVRRFCGEKLDPETGLDHIGHALCNVLFLLGNRSKP